MKKIKFFAILILLIMSMVFLTGCDGDNPLQNIFSTTKDSFSWFFSKLTPQYFRVLKDIWAIMGCVEVIFETSTIIGVIIGIIMAILIFIIVLLLSVILIAGYIILLLIFLALFIVLFVLGIVAAIILIIVNLLLSN